MATKPRDGRQAPPGEHSGGPPYAEVIVDAHTTQLRDTFTYSVPPHLDLQPGHLVRVPFGRRRVHGIVSHLTDVLHVDYVKPVLGVVYPEPLLDPWRLDLARWVSDYYMAPFFEAVAPMLPPGFRSRGGPLLRLAADAPVPERLPEGASRLLTYLRRHRRPLRASSLTRVLGPWAANAARALLQAGLLVEEPETWEAPSAGRTEQVLRPAADPREMLAFADTLVRAPKQAALLRRLAEPGAPYRIADVRAEFGASALAGVVGKGYAVVETAEPRQATVAHAQAALLPTPEQSQALAAINSAQDRRDATPRVFLLQGVTGSGKTEVYLQAIAHCLGLGRQALVLVPELSLTPQAVARFESRFPGRVGRLHSGLTPAQQWREWWDARQGKRGVVIGSRGAVFAPLPDIGLIVLDEEHEWTYKQTEAVPRYHARDVAVQIARMTGAVVVLGSATPDVASSFAAERGAYRLLTLPHRIERSGAPSAQAKVEVVDMRRELKAGNRSVFSLALRDALRETVESGKQALLFLNRRGAASIVECRTCGHAVRCWRCSTPYTYHSGGPGAKGILVCHHCNRRRRMPATCPNCRSRSIRYLGLGTQRVVDEVQSLLPKARVLRWDRDTAATAAAHEDLLRRLSDGEADVLVGTQMVAKGLDLASIELVGVVLADVGLNFPDFRAPERTFQVLTQVAGRAGRGGAPGRAIIQTYQPEHYAIQAAADQDYAAFYEREMAHRRAQHNPPFSRLVRLVFGHSDEGEARKEATRLGGVLRRVMREWDMHGVDVVGPAPTYPPRLRGAWRWHLLVRASDPRLLLDKVSIPPGWLVDVDPINVM